jgi:hypothetical protein
MASVFCPVCGTENPSTRLFCRKCAADLHAPATGATAPAATEPAPVPIRPILVGIGIAALLIAILLGALSLLGRSPEASSSPSPIASVLPGSATPTIVPPPTTVAPSATLVVPPPTATGATSEATLEPAESGLPVVDSFSGPSSASCTGDNGTGTAGYIRLRWTASNTPGVRLSIDPPAPNTAYGYGYDDYPASGTADLPFTCEPPSTDSRGAYHLYVATTVHEGGYFAWRLIKVYLKP